MFTIRPLLLKWCALRQLYPWRQEICAGERVREHLDADANCVKNLHAIFRVAQFIEHARFFRTARHVRGSLSRSSHVPVSAA
jgi:hypothetical protein